MTNTILSWLRVEHCDAPSQWLMLETTLARSFPHVPAALANAGRITDACRTNWASKKTIFPVVR